MCVNRKRRERTRLLLDDITETFRSARLHRELCLVDASLIRSHEENQGGLVIHRALYGIPEFIEGSAVDEDSWRREALGENYLAELEAEGLHTDEEMNEYTEALRPVWDVTSVLQASVSNSELHLGVLGYSFSCFSFLLCLFLYLVIHTLFSFVSLIFIGCIVPHQLIDFDCLFLFCV